MDGRPAEVGDASTDPYRALVETMGDAVVAFADDGTVTYVNGAASDMLGHDAADVIGRSIAEFIHPDDVGRALEMVELVTADDRHTVHITPAVYRLRCLDGTFLPIEFLSLPADATGLGHITTVGRFSGDQRLHRELLEVLTTGQHLDDALALVPEFGRWRHPGEHYTLVVDCLEGGHRCFGDPLPAELSGLYHDDAGSTAGADTGPESTIDEARRTGVAVRRPTDELPATHRAAAEAAGLAGCWIVPVADPLFDRPAVIVVWSVVGGPPLLMHRYGAEVMAQALTLVLQWRHQLHGLQHAAMHDALTGIANRAGFFSHLDMRAVGAHTAILYVDLDRFKPVNDQFGHRTGDLVLIEVTRRMQSVVRPGDLVARLGGDEFAVLCPGVSDTAEATAIADRVVRAVAEPMVLGGERITVGASVGVAVSDEPPGEWLLDAADSALYEVKATGKGAWSLARTS